jgi:hypothetical protein
MIETFEIECLRPDSSSKWLATLNISRSRNNLKESENKGAGEARTLIFGDHLGIASSFVKY